MRPSAQGVKSRPVFIVSERRAWLKPRRGRSRHCAIGAIEASESGCRGPDGKETILGRTRYA